jgi:eukaryotic-like serine/threonine-protein kinase
MSVTELGPSSKIGRYQLVSAIGAGGMGRVWVALDSAAPSLRLVALKTTLNDAEAHQGPEFWAMLSDEASLASRINHPNVCATYELGQEGSTHFMVMDWSDGASLRDLLDASPGKRIAPEIAAVIAAGVAAGLHAAHELSDEQGNELGVVHRDVSPQNVLVSTKGIVRLADFGVAKARGQQHRPTETGEVKGKLSYMAPEQVTSKNIDRRADVFALGCVLYEATLGVRPFHGGDALATLYKILEEDLTRPRSLDPTYPERLEEILVKALTKDPAQRYQTADELRADLMEYLAQTKRFYGDKHVAELLMKLLGDKLRERNRTILAAAEQLRRGEPLLTPPPSPSPDPSHTLTPEGGIERSVTMGRPGDPPAWRSAAMVAFGTAALMIATLVAWNLTREPRVAPTPAPLAPPAAPQVAAAPTPITAPRPAPEEMAPSTVAPPATPDAAATVPASSKSNSGTTKVGKVRPPVVATPVPAAPAPTPSAKPAGKTPRPIDRDNPFGNP